MGYDIRNGSAAGPTTRRAMVHVHMAHLRSTPLVAALLAGAALGLCGPSPALAQPAPAATPPAQRPAQPPKPKPPARPAATAPAQPPAAATGGAQPQLLGQYGGWGAYTASPGGRKVCFALAKPSRADTTPPNRPRDPAFLFVSSRPGERVKDEISVIFGYGFKPNADATLEVGGASFAMYTQADGGWIKNAAEEPRLVESLRRANDATIKGVSARGTASTDVYVLKGLAQALDRVAQECR